MSKSLCHRSVANTLWSFYYKFDIHTSRRKSVAYSFSIQRGASMENKNKIVRFIDFNRNQCELCFNLF